MAKIDKIDETIINILLENARMPLKDIAEKVNLSSPTVSSRIDRLMNAGIITGYHAEIDAEKMGYTIKAFIDVAMSPESKQQFKKIIPNYPNIVECHNITGDYSMLLQVLFHDSTELDLFVGELQKYGRTNTRVVLSSPVALGNVKLR